MPSATVYRDQVWNKSLAEVIASDETMRGRLAWLDALREGPMTVRALVIECSGYWVENDDNRVQRRASTRARWLSDCGFADSLDQVFDLETELRLSARGEWLLRWAELSSGNDRVEVLVRLLERLPTP